MSRMERGERWEVHQGEARRWLEEHGTPDSMDALVIDPPYSSGGFTRGDRTLPALAKYRQSGAGDYAPGFDGDGRDQLAFVTWLSIVLAEALPLVRPGGGAVVFTDWRQFSATIDAFQAGGFVWRGLFTWTKANASRPQMGRFRADAEYAVWGSRGEMPPREDVGVLSGSIDCPPVPSSHRVHLTEKPVEVMRAVVRLCPPGGTVLDLFAGSGSTGVAALREGRRFVGVELAAHNVDLARDRLRAEETASTLEAVREGQAPLFGGA